MNSVSHEDLPQSAQPNERFLTMVHLKTRSVCGSRMSEWRDGHRWRFREVADKHGNMDGTIVEAMIEMPSRQQPRARKRPCVGRPLPKKAASPPLDLSSKRSGGQAPSKQSATSASARERAPPGRTPGAAAAQGSADRSGPNAPNENGTPRWTHNPEDTKWTT